MAAKFYALAELKQLALDSANAIGLTTPYEPIDADKSYDSAVSFCGYENPNSSDADYLLKQRFLLEAMQLYFLKDVQRKYLLKFDVGDLKLGQVSREIREMIKDMSASLVNARDNPATAALFINAAEYFGQLVAAPGISDDAIGQSVKPDEV